MRIKHRHRLNNKIRVKRYVNEDDILFIDFMSTARSFFSYAPFPRRKFKWSAEEPLKFPSSSETCLYGHSFLFKGLRNISSLLHLFFINLTKTLNNVPHFTGGIFPSAYGYEINIWNKYMSLLTINKHWKG